MPVSVRITDRGVIEESSLVGSLSIEVPSVSRSGTLATSTATVGSYTAPSPGFYFITGAAASGSLFTVPNPANTPGGELSVAEIGTNQALLSGAYAGKTFVLSNGTSRGSVLIVPVGGSAAMKSNGTSWCVFASSGSLTVYT